MDRFRKWLTESAKHGILENTIAFVYGISIELGYIMRDGVVNVRVVYQFTKEVVFCEHSTARSPMNSPSAHLVHPLSTSLPFSPKDNAHPVLNPHL